MAPIIAELIARARDAGELRADILPHDFRSCRSCSAP